MTWEAPKTESPTLREDLVTQATRFLTDSRTKASNPRDKERFLKDKGLTDDEIAAAFARSSQSTVSTLLNSNYNDPSNQSRPLYIPPPIIEEPILWSAVKSVFSALGAIAIGVVGYHLYQKELSPQRSISLPIETKIPAASESVTQDQLDEAVRRISATQELRHKEIMLSIRGLTSMVEGLGSPVRKPGGSISVRDDDKDYVFQGKIESTRPEEVPIATEFSLATEVSLAIENGTDIILQLILTSLEKYKKLNKSNQRFEKLGNCRLLDFCGFKDTGDYWELGTDMETYTLRGKEVISEVLRQRESGKESREKPIVDPEFYTSNGDTPTETPPWIA
jgi:hypothetical protein